MSDVFSDMFILIDCVILSSAYWKRGKQVRNINDRSMVHFPFGTCSRSTMETLNVWRRSGVFIINLNGVLATNLNRFLTFFWCLSFWLWANKCRPGFSQFGLTGNISNKEWKHVQQVTLSSKCLCLFKVDKSTVYYDYSSTFIVDFKQVFGCLVLSR